MSPTEQIKQITANVRREMDEIDQLLGAGPTVRTCHFGYFGDTPTTPDEVYHHADLYWAYGWPTGTTAISTSQRAKALGMKIMLGLYGPGGQAGMEYFLQQCKDANILDAVIGLYPMDEPDVAGLSNAQATAMFNQTRAAAAKFWTVPPPVCVIYGNNGYPGIAAADVIGRDNYGNGPQMVPLTGTQQMMIVPGGADPWKEEPYPFVQYAQDNPDVWGVIGFYWNLENPGSAPGVMTNGMAAAYIQAGQTLTGRS